MSSISPNPSPNPEIAMINQPSTSNPPREPLKSKRKKKKKKSKKARKPNWLELPEDVWYMILSKLKTFDIIEKAQLVCMLFRKICKQPAMFKIMDLCRPLALPYEVYFMTRFAVDQSAGGLVDITLRSACDDDTLTYIVDRSKNIKRLVLMYYNNRISDECLIEAVKKLPMLEELQLIICSFSDKTMEAVGRACPSLKSFSLIHKASNADLEKFGYDDPRVRAVAKSMPQLRHLQLIGNGMSDNGLKAILDGCPLLESLDLRSCSELKLSGNLRKRCEKINRVRYPDERIDDFPWQADDYQWWDEDYDYQSEDDYYSNLQEGDYDDYFREDENYRLYRDHYRGALFGYESSD